MPYIMLVETHILQVIKKKMKKPLHEQRLSKHYMDSKYLRHQRYLELLFLFFEYDTISNQILH